MNSFLESFHSNQPTTLYRPKAVGTEILFHQEFLQRPIHEYCQKPVTGDVFYLENGQRIARKIGSIETAYPYFKLLKNKNQHPTLFIHRIEKIEKTLEQTIQDIGPNQTWRFSNISASISTENSTIGFHGDTMDVILVQIIGSRTWRFWDINRMDKNYIHGLEKGIALPAISNPGPPDFTFELNAGDALFIPAHWGHEGVTTSKEVSFSLSMSWNHFTPYMFLYGLLEIHPEWRDKIQNKAFFTGYKPAVFSKNHLQDYLMSLLMEDHIPVTPEDLVASIDLVLTNFSSQFTS